MADQDTRVGAENGTTDKLDYGPAYFRNYWGGGGPYERNERWLNFFDGVAEGIIRDFHPTTVLDAGCAMGFLVEGLRKRGVNASGIDISEYAISQVHESIQDHCEVASLTEPLKQRYDLITTIEVIEHIPATEVDKVIANLCAATDQLLLSSTPQDFGEPTHVNVQPPEAWSAALAREGFLRDLDHDLSYVSPWAALYTRREEPTAEIVRRYDRAWWRLRQETMEVRNSLLDSQERLTTAEASLAEGEESNLQEKLDRAGEEVLRLRDIAIGKDAELGAMRGRLAELEDHSRRFADAAAQIQSRVPGVLRLAVTAIRKLLRR